MGVLLEKAKARAVGARADASIRKPSKQHTEMKKQRALLRALYGGTAAMRARGRLSLPQEAGESDKGYLARLNRTVLFNAVRRSVRTIVGKPFARPVAQIDINPEVEGWLENIDGLGRDLEQFGRDLMTDGSIDGLSHFLCEMREPIRDGEGNIVQQTRAEAAARGKNVYWVQYCEDEVLGWVYEVVDGNKRLELLRLEEMTTEPSGEFGMVERLKVRCIYPGWWEVWRPEDWDRPDGDWLLESNGPATHRYPGIPWVTYYANRTGYLMAEPPLLDLGYLNEGHWQSSSDQRNILHVGRVPILFGSGWHKKPGDKLELGASRFVSQTSEKANLRYVEITGQAISAGQADLERFQSEMAMVALEMFMPRRPGDITATEKAIDAAESHSAAQAMALNLQQALNEGIRISAEMRGLSGDPGSVQVHSEFSISMREASDIRELREMEMAGQISRKTLWEELKRRDVFSRFFDSEEEIDRLEEEQDELLAGGGGNGSRPSAQEMIDQLEGLE